MLLPALFPALPAAMADDTSMGGHLATARATQLVTSSDDGAAKSASEASVGRVCRGGQRGSRHVDAMARAVTHTRVC